MIYRYEQRESYQQSLKHLIKKRLTVISKKKSIRKRNCARERFYRCVFRRVGISDNTLFYKIMMLVAELLFLIMRNEATDVTINTM